MDDAWLATVKIARDVGQISSLFPDGIKRLWDLPYTLFNNIRLALIFLSWQENLPKKEVPPKKMWLDEEKLTMWWAEVEANREREAKGEGDTLSMPENPLLKQLLGASHG